MRHHKSGRKLSRPTGHRLSLYRNQVRDLITYEQIVTTEAKAKEVRRFAERMITLGKAGDLHSRRLALRFITDHKVIKKVFDDLGPHYKARQGGYTRIIRLGPRHGDGAKLAQLEFVDRA